MNSEEFWRWAETEVYAGAGLNWHRVERLAGLSNGSISRRARERRPPTEGTCRALATVMNYDLDMVRQRAGLRAPEPESTILLREVARLFAQLPPERKQFVATTLRALVQEQGREGRAS